MNIRLTLVLMAAFWSAALTMAWAEIPLQKTDEEILLVLSMIDQNEIQASELAQQKNIDHQILDFARMMDKEHHEHLDKTRKLAQELNFTAADNQAVENLRLQGQKDLGALTALDGPSFAQLYIADMVKGHSEALDWIERQKATNKKVTQLLENTRPVIAGHFQAAQKIQQAQTGNAE